MKAKSKILFMFVSALIFISHKGNCQQSPVFTQYMFNGLAINPAYAGSHESMSITALFRKQWVQFEGAPSTQTLSAHTPLKKEKIALGLLLMNDYIGVTHQYAFDGIYAYRIKVSGKGKLSFGLQAGVGRFISQYSTLETKDPNDPAFTSDQSTSFMLNFGTGIYYHTPKFYAGLSVPHLLNNEMEKTASTSISNPARHYFFTTGYIFQISHDLKLKPSTLVKVIEGAPAQMDINCNLLIKEVIWIGASYRSFSSLSLITQVQLTDQMSIGYAYDNVINKLHVVLKGSHEFIMTYNFNFLGSKVVSPRYF